jgi:hypothetical protein
MIEPYLMNSGSNRSTARLNPKAGRGILYYIDQKELFKRAGIAVRQLLAETSGIENVEMTPVTAAIPRAIKLLLRIVLAVFAQAVGALPKLANVVK